jgi:Mrp family chromosome partitioning ATPase
MEKGGAPGSAGAAPGAPGAAGAPGNAPAAFPKQASRRFASAPTQEVPAYPSAPPAGAAVGQAAEAPPEAEAEPLASFAPPLRNGVPSGASAFLSRATRVPTFAEGPLPPGCDELAGLRAALLSLGLGQTPATIMVAGASSATVTTAVAVGLAGEIARDLAHQVLLIDANVSKPGAMRMLDVDPVLEFADVLEGRASAGEAIVHSETDNLSALVLRPDPVSGRSRATAESFLGDTARRAMGELQAAFDHVVVDAGAVAKSAVPKVLAARATGTVLVLARGVARESASTAKRAVEGGGGRILGVVRAGGPGTPRGRDPRGGGVTGAFVVPGAGAGGGRGF